MRDYDTRILDCNKIVSSEWIYQYNAKDCYSLDSESEKYWQSNYQIDLSSTKIDCSNFASYICNKLKLAAFSVNDRIFLSENFKNFNLEKRLFIFAHELTHVAQYVLGKKIFNTELIAASSQLELEAHFAAHHILSNKNTFSHITPSKPNIISAWEEPGHYYTVYLTALVAGYKPDIAEKLAFFTQMADEVIELDAKEAAVGTAASVVLRGILGPVHERVLRRVPVPDVRAVQLGLHCLTGRNAAIETRVRKNIISGINPILNYFEFGLALHAFGDSYAHRKGSGQDSSDMHHFFFGHGPQSVAAAMVKGTFVENVCEESDGISERPDLYIKYCKDLYDVLISRNSTSTPKVLWVDFSQALKNFTRKPEGDLQISEMRDYALKIGSPLSGYKPEQQNAVLWYDFCAKHRGMTNYKMLATALDIANQWADRKI